MARPKDEDLGDDFSYILRMADTDMDGLKPLATALTSVKGVGARTAIQICKNTGFDAYNSPVSSTPSSKSNSVSPLNPTPTMSRCGCSTDSETSKLATRFT